MAESLLSSSGDVRPRQFRNHFEEYIFVFTVMLAQSSTTFLQGVVVINTATIGKSLHMTSPQITWISAAIALASGSLMIFFGKTADIFRRKVQLLTGMGLLSILSLATAFAPSGISLNILCGFLGLGTAIIAPPAIGTLFATYPEGLRRNRVMGWLGVGNPIGFILGSFSSALSSKIWSWRASFITVSIFFFVLTFLAVWTMPSTIQSGKSSKHLQRFDWLGALLTTIGMALLTASLTESSDLGWKNFRVILMLVLGISCLAGFGFWEYFFRNPLIDPIVWKNKNFTLCILCVFFGYMSFITNQVWLCLYMQDVQHFSPLVIAARLLPQALFGVLWSYVGQWMASRFNGTRIMGIGAIAYIIGATLCYFIRQNSTYWTFLFFELLITVVGADFQFIVSNLYISQQMPTQSSLAAGVLQTAMRLSIAVGLGITSAVFWASSKSEKAKADVTYPYERAFLSSIAFTVVGFCFVPFLKIGKQGKKRVSLLVDTREIEERPRSAAEYSGQASDGRISSKTHYVIRRTPSEASILSAATVGSIDSYFPRWSWETQWLDDRMKYNSGASPFRYEVCIRCLEERRVIVLDGSNGNFNPYLGPQGWITQPYNISDPSRTRPTSSLRRNSDMIELDMDWPRSSYSEEFHHFQEHQDLHAYQDLDIQRGIRTREDQSDSLVTRDQLRASMNSRNGHSDSPRSTLDHNAKSEHGSGTTYYSFDGLEAARSAADLRKQHTRKSQRDISGTRRSEHESKPDTTVQFNFDGSKEMFKSQSREGRNLLGHRRGRHAFDNHEKDRSLGGDTLHEVQVDFPTYSSRDMKQDLSTRSIMKSKGRFPVRFDKEVQFVSSPSLDSVQAILLPSFGVRKYTQTQNHQPMTNAQHQIFENQLPNERQDLLKVEKTHHSTQDFQTSAPNFSFQEGLYRRDESGHSHPSTRTLLDSQSAEPNSTLKRQYISNSHRSQGSIVEIRLGSEVRRSDGSNCSNFSFTPSTEIPPRSPLRETSCFQNSVGDERLDEVRRSHSSHSKVALEIPRSLLLEKSCNEAQGKVAHAVETSGNQPNYALSNCPEIPQRRSSLLLDVPVPYKEPTGKQSTFETSRSTSQTSKKSHVPSIEIRQSSNTHRSGKISPSHRLYYDGVKEEKLGGGNWV